MYKLVDILREVGNYKGRISKYTDNMIIAAAKKHKSAKELKAKDPNAYHAAKHRGMLPDLRQYYTSGKKFYSNDDIRKLAQEYEYVEDFKDKHYNIYIKATVRGIWDDIKKGLKKREGYKPMDRLVYAWEFPDQNYAYIGLTADEEIRRKAHQSLTAKRETAVSRYLRRNGIGATDENYKILSKSKVHPDGMLPEVEAVQLECASITKYERDGWQLLNLAPCGGLGGTVYDEEKVLQSMDNFINSTDTSLNAAKLLSGSKYLVNAIKQENRQDEVFKRIEAIVKENNIKSTTQLKAKTNPRLGKLIEDWSKKYRGEGDNWQAKLFPDNISGLIKAKESVNAFLADPDNLDISQLKLITRTAIQQNLERKDEFKVKLEKIIKASGIQSNNELSKTYRAASDLIQKEKWTKELFPNNKSGPKKTPISESIVNKEVLKNIIKRLSINKR